MATNVRAIKDRIGNIEDIRQITRAMNAIAMTKVTRMKRRLEIVKPYIASLEEFLAILLGQMGEAAREHPLTAGNESSCVGVMVLNADRGLCGRYKGEVNRKGLDLVESVEGAVGIIAGGDKARTYFARQRVEIIKHYSHIYENPTMTVAKEMSLDLASLFLGGEVGKVVVVYMDFVSDLVQRIAAEEILPMKVEAKTVETLVEPSRQAMLEYVLHLYLQARLFSMLVKTKTSEHAIRRQAMKSATDNADDLLTVLTRSYNKARQQTITREIADIIGGAEALREA